MHEVTILKTELEKLEQHAIRDFPNECCGFLFGTAHQNGKTITSAFAVKNNKEGDQRRRFEIHPLDYIKAEKKALEENLELLGIYHSHPLHPAIPSSHDLKSAQASFSYFITSVNEKTINNTSSWILNQQQEFEEEKIILK